MKELVNETVLKVKGSFEECRECAVKEYHVYGTTVKQKLYPSDEKIQVAQEVQNISI